MLVFRILQCVELLLVLVADSEALAHPLLEPWAGLLHSVQ
uniref:Uncharacterized protein n=1 Tax=Setaria viridis TaxID=4556 RepID=A0A4U6W991_SETVI|nr:hypothetical protein SEVIR_1G145033v2 [Setaria viridis]